MTTTMYALVRNHDAFLNSINTIEKQPSGSLLNVTQTVYTLTDTGTTTYAKKLQTLVRMGPNVVGIGECEDAETAKIASAAAKDGKIVYVVMEADSVLQALGKWLKLVEDRKLVAETLLGISNQRLFRKLCETCKQGYAPNKELLKKFNLPAEKAKVLYRPGKEVFDKRGKPSTCEDLPGDRLRRPDRRLRGDLLRRRVEEGHPDGQAVAGARHAVPPGQDALPAGAGAAQGHRRHHGDQRNAAGAGPGEEEGAPAAQ